MYMITARKFLIISSIVLLAGAMLARSGWTQGENLPLQHTQEEGDLRRCSECHDTETH